MPKTTDRHRLNLQGKRAQFHQDQAPNLQGQMAEVKQAPKDLRLLRNNKILAQDNKHLLVPQTLVITMIEYKEMLPRTHNTNMADQETNQVNNQN